MAPKIELRHHMWRPAPIELSVPKINRLSCDGRWVNVITQVKHVLKMRKYAKKLLPRLQVLRPSGMSISTIDGDVASRSPAAHRRSIRPRGHIVGDKNDGIIAGGLAPTVACTRC
jgi:hypothetical protein